MNTPNTVMIPDARPYAWPCIAPVDARRLALVIIDMQKDFCAPGGYIDSQGVDLTPARATIEPIRRVLDAFRALPDSLVIHTREGHRPELVDLPANKQWRSEQVCPGIGNEGPLGKILVRGEPGWEIIPELAPAPGEIVLCPDHAVMTGQFEIGVKRRVRGISVGIGRRFEILECRKGKKRCACQTPQ